MNIRSNKTRLIVLIVGLAAVVLLGWYFFFAGSNVAPSNTNTSELNVAASPTPGSTNQPGGVGARETPKANSGEQVIVKIRGTIKREDTSESVSEAIVALYNGDKRGTQPQTAENGRFEFSSVPLRADITYTLQAKIPGLCAEEPVTLKNAEQGVITKNMILKRCLSEPSATPPNKPETAPLTDISTGIKDLRGAVGSIASTLGFAIPFCLVLIVLSLLSVTFMVFRLEKRFADDSPRIDQLYQWKNGIDTTLASLTRPQPPAAQPVLSLTSELSQTLTDLTQEMKQLIAVLPDLVQPKSETSASHFRPNSAERQKYGARQTVPGARSSQPLQNAVEWYKSLVMFGEVSPPPIYLEINFNLSDRSRVESNPQISFDELPHLGSFVLFRESTNQTRGWVFPNPNTNFAADHSWVFANLNATNFLKELANLKPKELRLNDGVWQLNL